MADSVDADQTPRVRILRVNLCHIQYKQYNNHAGVDQ